LIAGSDIRGQGFGPVLSFCAAVLALQLAASAAFAQAAPLPRITTNESYVDEIARSGLDLDNARSVFQHVLDQLPGEVRVYPTENYYYFAFFQDGVRYTGNIRLDIDLRDKGEVDFNYFREASAWQRDRRDYYVRLGAKDGVDVVKVSDFVYRISSGGKSVTFALNDLSAVRPPSLVADETFLGPVFDESGIRFFLIFDEKRKLFRYVLDETVKVADELMDTPELPHIALGRRTGFAFFKDDAASRKILIGVHAGNAEVNNFFDGPFDQLPDNFLKGDALRRAILLARPDTDPAIDRLGNRPGGDQRELIDAYKRYERASSLAPFEKCAAGNDPDWTYRCLDTLFTD
jgi:hypothetical protein